MMGLQCMTLFMLKHVLSCVGSIVVCLCVKLAIASGSGVLVFVGLYRFVSF